MSFAEFIVRFSAFGIYDLFENGLIRRITAAGEPGSWQNALAIGIGVVLCIVVSYLLGSINTALIISKRLFKDDIREHGSGNAGTTNVLRTYGKKPAILTFVGDALKVVVAIVFAGLLFGCPASELNYLYLATVSYMSAFFCIFGHVFPIFSHFRGGKGFATLVGSILVLDPFLFVILFIVYVPMVLCSHYISLSSVVIALFYPLMLSAAERWRMNFGLLPLGIGVLFSVMIGVLIAWAHRENIKRIYNGTERKFYLGKKHKAAKTDGEKEQ